MSSDGQISCVVCCCHLFFVRAVFNRVFKEFFMAFRVFVKSIFVVLNARCTHSRDNVKVLKIFIPEIIWSNKRTLDLFALFPSKTIPI